MAKPAAAGGAAAAPEKKGKKKTFKKKERKHVPHGLVHVQASFNNTIVTISDMSGNVLAWKSSGSLGFRGSRKGTPFAAQQAASNAASMARDHGVRTVDVRVSGPGSGRESAVRALASARGGGRGGGRGDATVTDVRAAGELLMPLARRCGADLERFRAEIALGAETDALDPRAEAITLLTLHGAKGLEFDVVFLAGCERGLLPLRLPGSGPLTPDQSAEERRLLFVGMSRARGRLVLTCAARRTRQGAGQAAGRSPFLASVSPDLLGPAAPPRARRSADRQLRLL